MKTAGPLFEGPIADALKPENCAKLVIKVGSSLLVAGDGGIRKNWLASFAADIAERHRAGQEIVIVSSGAVALGARRLKLKNGGRTSLAAAQASASVGQILLSGCWSELLEAHDITAAQMLVTLDDLEDRRRYLNVSATVGRLLKSRAVPIFNENDSVATHEIRFGDNDRLAARVAQASGADGILLLSDIDGLYDGDPSHAGTKVVSVVHTIDGAIRDMVAGGSASDMGTGGMGSKLDAAEIANMAGINLAISSGLMPNPLRRFDEGDIGTLFVGDQSPGARKAWLGGRLTTRGRIIVDEGAAKALSEGNSLLPAGALSAEGPFNRGDVVNIKYKNKIIARGLAEYNIHEVRAICGKQTGEMEKILGAVMRNVLVHRDHMIML